MKIIKKIFIGSLLLLLLMPAIFVNAVFETDVVKSFEEVTNQDLASGIKLHQYKTNAYNDGIIDEERLNDYIVSWFDYDVDQDVRIVNYCYDGKENFSTSSATALARKYEKTHPGYLVVGAINGDFFRIDDSGEVKNVSMTEGELYKPYIWHGTGLGVIGWTYDGKIIDGVPTISNNMYVETLNDEGLITVEKEVTSVNKGISNNGISVITKDVDVEGGTKYDLTGCTVVELTYVIHRYSLDGYGPNGNNEGDILFVKGNVTNIYTNLGSEEIIKDGCVYLVSKDGSLDYINLGDNLRVQYHLTDDWSNVYNTTGYYAKILEDGNSLFYQSTYNDYSHLDADKFYINCKKNRTVIGEKPDGTTILMTIEYNKTGNYGASYYECAEYLKSVGCVNGWLLDGGGSTTMAIKNLSGGFEMIAGGSDGHERSNGNAILLVIKDPGITTKVTSTERFSVTLDITENNSPFREDVSDISITVNGVTKQYNNEPLTFDGLEEDTKYQVTISYKMKESDGNIVQGSLYSACTTASFKEPNIKIYVDQSSSDAVVIKKEEKSSLEGLVVSNYKVIIDDKEFMFEDGVRAYCSGLSKNKIYEAYLTYDVYEESTKNTYHITSSKLVVVTKGESLPMITSFKLVKHEGTKVTLSYSYYDPDNKVTDAYIKYVPDLYSVDAKEGTITLNNIDVRNKEYHFSFVIEYDGKFFETEAIILEQADTLPPSSEVITPPTDDSNGGCGGCGNNQVELILSLTLCAFVIYIMKKNK